MTIGDDDILGCSTEGAEVPQRFYPAGEDAVAQSGIVVVGRVNVAILCEALIEPGRDLVNSPSGGFTHQQMGELMGDRAGYGWVEPVDQQHPFVAEGHSLGLQSFAHRLGAKWQGRGHVPVVVVGNYAQRLGRRDAQHRQHFLKVCFGGFKNNVGAGFDVLPVVINRDQVLNYG